MISKSLLLFIAAVYCIAATAANIWLIVSFDVFGIVADLDWVNHFRNCVAADAIMTTIALVIVLLLLSCARDIDTKNCNFSTPPLCFKTAVFIWAVIIAIHSDGDHVELAELYAIIVGVEVGVLAILSCVAQCVNDSAKTPVLPLTINGGKVNKVVPTGQVNRPSPPPPPPPQVGNLSVAPNPDQNNA